jgi:hypothetical protein
MSCGLQERAGRQAIDDVSDIQNGLQAPLRQAPAKRCILRRRKGRVRAGRTFDGRVEGDRRAVDLRVVILRSGCRERARRLRCVLSVKRKTPAQPDRPPQTGQSQVGVGRASSRAVWMRSRRVWQEVPVRIPQHEQRSRQTSLRFVATSSELTQEVSQIQLRYGCRAKFKFALAVNYDCFACFALFAEFEALIDAIPSAKAQHSQGQGN